MAAELQAVRPRILAGSLVDTPGNEGVLMTASLADAFPVKLTLGIAAFSAEAAWLWR